MPNYVDVNEHQGKAEGAGATRQHRQVVPKADTRFCKPKVGGSIPSSGTTSLFTTVRRHRRAFAMVSGAASSPRCAAPVMSESNLTISPDDGPYARVARI
jgi:hypothetical protein